MPDSSGHPSDLGLLAEYAPALVTMLAQVASDIAMVLDSQGVIQKVVHGGADAESLRFLSSDWVGRALEDTVTVGTRKKVEELLRDVSAKGVSNLRHLNHSNPAGTEIPFAYSVVRLGEQGPLLAVGRDLRTVMAMQQRFTSTQQEMERHYWKMRQAESRYRLIFHMATDAVLVIDPATLRITDSNHAAARLFGLTSEQLVGHLPTIGIEPEFAASVEGALASALSAGTTTEVRVRLAKGGHAARVTATPHVSQGPSMLLLRARLVVEQGADPHLESTLAGLVERTQDAIVITDQRGNIILANPAFATMLEIENEERAIGCPLGRWLGAAENSVPSTIASLMQSGVVPLQAATLRTERGRMLQVERSAALLPSGAENQFGFILRLQKVHLLETSLEPGSTRNLH